MNSYEGSNTVGPFLTHDILRVRHLRNTVILSVFIIAFGSHGKFVEGNVVAVAYCQEVKTSK